MLDKLKKVHKLLLSCLLCLLYVIKVVFMGVLSFVIGATILVCGIGLILGVIFLVARGIPLLLPSSILKGIACIILGAGALLLCIIAYFGGRDIIDSFFEWIEDRKRQKQYELDKVARVERLKRDKRKQHKEYVKAQNLYKAKNKKG